MERTIVRSVSLYYKDSRSDKEYHLSIERDKTGWSDYYVVAKFGPRGGTLTHVDKTKGKPTSYGAAIIIFDKTEREKRSKGYKEAVTKTPLQLMIERLKKDTSLGLYQDEWETIAETVLMYLEEAA